MSEQVEEKEAEGSDLDPRLILPLLAVPFIPSALIAGFLWVVFQRWGVFRKFHQPVGNVAFLTLPLAAVLTVWLVLRRDAFTAISTAVQPQILVPLWVSLGLAGGFTLCALGQRKIEREEWLKEDSKHWASRYKPRKSLMQTRREKANREKLSAGQAYGEAMAPLGLSEADGHIVHRDYDEANTHTLITGQTGSGKSVGMRQLIYNDLQKGMPVFFLDLKRSLPLAEKLAAWCEREGLSFKHFIDTPDNEYRVKSNPAGPSFYDPLLGLRAEAKGSALLNMRKWDAASDFHRSGMQTVLTNIFGMLDEAEPFYTTDANLRKYHLGELGDLKRFQAIIKNPAGLSDLLTVIPPTSQRYADFENLVSQVAPEGKKRGGPLMQPYEILRNQLSNFSATAYGRWIAVDARHEGLDLQELSSTPGVVLFSINGDESKEFAEAFGSVILKHITDISGWRERQNIRTPMVGVYVDEFAILNPESVSGLLQRGRSSGMCVTLALQSFEQIVVAADKAGENLLRGYIDTVGNFILYSGINYATAELMSNLFGKRWKKSYNISHKSNAGWFTFNRDAKQHQQIQQSQREEWVLDPTMLLQVKKAMKGRDGEWQPAEAYYISKNSKDERRVRVSGEARQAIKFAAFVPKNVSEDEEDEGYVMDVGGAAQDYVAELKGFADEATVAGLMTDLEEKRLWNEGGLPSPPPAPETVPAEQDEEAAGGFDIKELSEDEAEIELVAEKLRYIMSRSQASLEEQQWVRKVTATHKNSAAIRDAFHEGKAMRPKPQKSYNAHETSPNSAPSNKPETALEEALPPSEVTESPTVPARRRHDQGW